jgi:hypothetical protein
VIALVAGAVVWALTGTLWLGAPAVVVTYFVWCWVFPYRTCWRCDGVVWRTDGKSNKRPRNCRVCADRGHVRRWGAALIGMVKP